MITDDELAALCDKSSRDPELVKLYREHDYLTAYAMHTNMRVKKDPHDAIGGLWEEYGKIQAEYLVSKFLHPGTKFLDLGCGTGRLARKIVPYLDKGNYVGVDISIKAIVECESLALREGWWEKEPRFTCSVPNDIKFDVAWAFSVFIHLPQEIVAESMHEISSILAPYGRFFFSYVPTDKHVRTGLKQFKHPYSFFEEVADSMGRTVAQCPDWPGRQKIAVMI